MGWLDELRDAAQSADVDQVKGFLEKFPRLINCYVRISLNRDSEEGC